MALLANFSSLDEIKKASIDKLKALGFPEKVAIELKTSLEENK